MSLGSDIADCAFMHVERVEWGDDLSARTGGTFRGIQDYFMLYGIIHLDGIGKDFLKFAVDPFRGSCVDVHHLYGIEPPIEVDYHYLLSDNTLIAAYAANHQMKPDGPEIDIKVHNLLILATVSPSKKLARGKFIEIVDTGHQALDYPRLSLLPFTYLLGHHAAKVHIPDYISAVLHLNHGIGDGLLGAHFVPGRWGQI